MFILNHSCSGSGGTSPVGTVFTAQKRFSMATTGSTQDVTISGVTATPVAARVTYCGRSVSDGIESKAGIMGVGFATATNNVGYSMISFANSTVTGYRTQSDTYALNATLDGVDPLFRGSIAFIAGGIRITWATNPGAAYFCLLEIYWGSDVSVDCGIHSLGTTAGATTINLTNCDPSSENCLLFTATVGLPTTQSVNTIALFTFGVATNDGGIAQGAQGLGSGPLGTSSSTICSWGSSIRASAQVYNDALTWHGTITDFSTANEIEITTNVSPGDDGMGYLCIGVGTKGVYVSSQLSPTTSPISWGGYPGWTSQSLGIVATTVPFSNAIVRSYGAMTQYQAASNSENSNGACVGFGERRTSSPIEPWVWSDDQLSHYDGTDAIVNVSATAGTLGEGDWLDVTADTISIAQNWLCWVIEA